MNITLTQEIEQVLTEKAKKQGITAERLAIKTLRECFLPKKRDTRAKPTEHSHEAVTLADRLADYIGSIDSGDIVEGGAQMSENTGKQFEKILSEKRQQGKL